MRRDDEVETEGVKNQSVDLNRIRKKAIRSFCLVCFPLWAVEKQRLLCLKCLAYPKGIRVSLFSRFTFFGAPIKSENAFSQVIFFDQREGMEKLIFQIFPPQKF